MQTFRDITDASTPDYYAEHLLPQCSMQALPSSYTPTLQEEEILALVTCAAPALTRQTDLSALVRVAATCSGSAIHTHALLAGDHITVANGRVKSVVTCHDEDQLMEVKAPNGGAITSQTVLALSPTAPMAASMASRARLRGEDVSCVVPPPRSVRLRRTMQAPSHLHMEKTCAVVAFRPGALSLSPPQSTESPKFVSIVQPTRNGTPTLDTKATRSAILQCFHEFAEPDLVVEDANLDLLGLDSIAIVELRNSIAKETGVELENALILSNPSVGDIIENVLSNVGRESASPVAAVSDRDEQEPQLSARRLDPVSYPHARAVARPALFVLSTPRAGSSLLQLCLEASPLLYAPQELYLLPFDTLDERIKGIGRAAGLDGGLIAAVGNLRGDAGALVASWEANKVNTRHVYRMLAEWTAPRLFCDKTPGYAFDSTTLSRAERLMASPRYLSTVRHPVACIESWIELDRKNLILQNKDASKVTWTDIEAKYSAFNGNIIDFLKAIPVHRRMSMRYEDLVTDPAGTLSTICDELLMIPYDDAMADPYAAGATKTFEAG